MGIRWALVQIAAALWLTLRTAAPAAPSEAVPRTYAEIEQRLLRSINEIRERNGREALRSDARLQQAAARLADIMALTGRFGHQADRDEPGERARKAGYRWCLVSENIARYSSSTEAAARAVSLELMNAWVNSKGHLKNILDSDVVEIGLSVARSPSSGTYYAAAVFARPQSMEISFSITNRTRATVRYTVEAEAYSVAPNATQTHIHCAPAELTFRLGNKANAATGRSTFRTRGGANYLIRPDKSGSLAIDELIQP